MSNKRYYKEPNGDDMWTLWEANCAICGKYIHESHPHEYLGEDVICPDCAFIEGIIEEEEYINQAWYSNPKITRATIRDGKIYVAGEKDKYPWEKTNQDHRLSQEYKTWRESVFKRDDFVCQICGKRGGELNAHHIKPFALYPNERFDVENGVTLCKSCHTAIHREKNDAWIYFGKQKNIGE